MRKFIVILSALASLAAPTSALADTDIQIAQKYWGGPCATQPVRMYSTNLTMSNPLSNGAKIVGAATGLDVLNEKREIWHLRECSFTVDSAWWAKASPYNRCVLVVHEMGHLAGHHHAEGGVMAADSAEIAQFPGCEVRLTFNARVTRYMESTPAARQEGKWFCVSKKPGVRTCVIEWRTFTSHDKTARYRFRMAGGRLVARRAGLR